MEQKIAILIADLSGYTALTETHGSATAADLIDKFQDIVKISLVGDSKFHQRVGDEVMIISTSPDHLIETAIILLQNCSQENHFLQVHGALNYGMVLKRNEHYFGSPINLTSRLAGKATKGTFWCSSRFINELSSPASFSFSSKGKHNFKNVSDGIDIFELLVENSNPFHIDPVCRMLIHKKETAVAHPYQQNIFFCSTDCLDIYKKGKTI